MKLPELKEEFLKYIANEKSYSKLTLKSYNEDLTQFLEFLEKENINNINNVNHIIIRKFLSLLSDKEYSKKSMVRKLAAVKSFFKYLYHREYIDKNPADYVSSPKLPEYLPEFLYEDEINNIIDSLTDSSFETVRNRAILEFLYSTGVRVSELVSINVSDVDINNGLIKVKGKGNKERIVALGSKALNALHNYLIYRNDLLKKDGKESKALFINLKGNRLTSRGVRYIFEEIIKKLALKKSISPHTIRHTFATHMLNHGCDLRVVQEFLGHSSLSTTQLYTHIVKDRLKDVYNKYHPHS